MTYVYGATLRGTAQFIMEHMEDTGKEFPPSDVISRYTLSLYMARKMFQGIGRTVPAAEFLMQWFKSMAREVPKGKRMQWRTPTGFLVQHDYQDFMEKRVKLRSCGVEDVIVREYTSGTRAQPMQNAISPNFVHAMDASHLCKTALRMQAQGADMVGIHDSYGTHPADVTGMHKAIREAFLELYKQDVLSEFMLDIGVQGEVPMRGKLDLSKVLESEFFFC